MTSDLVDKAKGEPDGAGDALKSKASSGRTGDAAGLREGKRSPRPPAARWRAHLGDDF